MKNTQNTTTTSNTAAFVTMYAPMPFMDVREDLKARAYKIMRCQLYSFDDDCEEAAVTVRTIMNTNGQNWHDVFFHVSNEAGADMDEMEMDVNREWPAATVIHSVQPDHQTILVRIFF